MSGREVAQIYAGSNDDCPTNRVNVFETLPVNHSYVRGEDVEIHPSLPLSAETTCVDFSLQPSPFYVDLRELIVEAQMVIQMQKSDKSWGDLPPVSATAPPMAPAPPKSSQEMARSLQGGRLPRVRERRKNEELNRIKMNKKKKNEKEKRKMVKKAKLTIEQRKKKRSIRKLLAAENEKRKRREQKSAMLSHQHRLLSGPGNDVATGPEPDAAFAGVGFENAPGE